MTHTVQTTAAKPEFIAAVRVRTRIAGIAQTWKPALDQVWAFLKANPALKPGHNLFLYHHGEGREAPMDIDFGVQVPARFEAQGNVRCVETTAGTVAFTRHIGPYDRLRAAHDEIHAWCRENHRPIGAASWETYGDWHEDPAKLETTISYLLR
jgi:effector-binding domain-containing protein